VRHPIRRSPWIVLALFAGVLTGPVAAASAAVTLSVDPLTPRVGSTVTFTGAVSPAGVTRVEIFKQTGSGWRLVVGGDSRPDGTYRLRAAMRAPGQIVARAAGSQSAGVGLRIKPTFSVQFNGARVLGGSLWVAGRVRPAASGDLVVSIRGSRRRIDPGAEGRFRSSVPTRQPGRVRVSFALDPAPGYAGLRRAITARVRAPVLRSGSRGPAVRVLERRLREVHYALRGVNARFASDTRDAVYAFQKIKGMARSGVVGSRTWRRLLSAHTPKAAVPRGAHIEVDKSKQVLFEVRRGNVFRVAHVSTGATGNTPIGRWRVYRKTAGFNVLSMYYSLYFHGGFAVHGYHSVPPFPASHGCVRVPLWYARGLYNRWGLGTPVYVLA
jgi:hypothetical protein